MAAASASAAASGSDIIDAIAKAFARTESGFSIEFCYKNMELLIGDDDDEIKPAFDTWFVT